MPDGDSVFQAALLMVAVWYLVVGVFAVLIIRKVWRWLWS